SLKTSIKTITYLSDIGCLEIQGASLPLLVNSMRVSLLIYRHVIVMSVSVASLRSVAFVDGPVAVMMTY
ncbi:hypothetical protein AB7W35_20935, partial [Escherichia coli]